MIKLIIFDYFGVFRTDTYEAWLEHNGLTREGPYFQASYDLDTGAISLDEFYARLSELSGTSVSDETFRAGEVLNEGVVELADKLHSSYKTALLSNSGSEAIRKMISETNIESLFDEIVVSGEIGMAKPAPEAFNYVLDKFGLDAEQAIFIDDNPKHVNGAKAVGIEAIRFESNEQLLNDLTSLGIDSV